MKGLNDAVYLGLARRYNNLFPDKSLEIGYSKGEIRDLANWILEKDADTPETSDQGSAFFLKNIGLVTAFHCIKGAKRIEVFHPHEPEKRFTVSVRKSCEHRDLAILDHAVPESKYLSLEMIDRRMRTGDAVQIVGYPSFGPGSSLQVREAKIVSQ